MRQNFAREHPSDVTFAVIDRLKALAWRREGWKGLSPSAGAQTARGCFGLKRSSGSLERTPVDQVGNSVAAFGFSHAPGDPVRILQHFKGIAHCVAIGQSGPGVAVNFPYADSILEVAFLDASENGLRRGRLGVEGGATGSPRMRLKIFRRGNARSRLASRIGLRRRPRGD